MATGFGTLVVDAACVVLVPLSEQPRLPLTAAPPWSRFLEVLRTPAIWSLALGVSGLFTAAYVGPAFLSTFVKAAHPSWGLHYAGFVGALAFISTVPGAWWAGRWSEQGQDRRVVLLIPAVLFGVAFLLLARANQLEIALLFAALGFLGGAVLAVALTIPSWLPSTSGDRNSAAIGIVESVEGIARFGGAAAFGLIEVAVGFGWAWEFTGLLALGTLPLVFGIPANRHG
ncbi:MAG: hypothetical protein WCB18_04625 [Thermoplasmata archaeon]